MDIDLFVNLAGLRAYTNGWFWLALVVVPLVLRRRFLGIPEDVLSRATRAARRSDEPDAQAALLRLADWLWLNLPRWHVSGADAVIAAALAGFVMSVLLVAGFVYDLQMAQSVALLGALWLVRRVTELAMAARLRHALAQDGAHEGTQIAAVALPILRRYGRWSSVTLVVMVLAIAFWAARWLALHPNGL